MDEILYILIGIVSLLATAVTTAISIPRLLRNNITGKDVNKPGQPEVAEMGGLSIVAGFSIGIMLAVFLQTFWGFEFNLVYVLASVITVHTVAFIGVVDDLLNLPQWLKALLPLLAAVPLVVVRAGYTAMSFPLIGTVDLGMWYVFVLIPIGVAVSSNLTNMLAGFNGMEAGMGSVIFIALGALGFAYGKAEMLVLVLPMLGALLGFLIYNRYPAKVFPGDVGNLTIGAVIAASVIIGNAEAIGALLLLLYVVDFFIKLVNRFPSSGWWGDYREGKLYAPAGRVRGLAQLVMKLRNGISEQELTMTMICIQALLAVGILIVYWPKG